MEVSWKDILEWTVKAGALGFTTMLCFFMAHHFVKKLVLDAIDDAKEMAKKSMNSTETLSSKVGALHFSVMTKSNEFENRIISESQRIFTLLNDSANNASTARNQSQKIADELKLHVTQSDNKMDTFNKVGHALVQQLKVAKIEITEIKKDVFLIREKKDHK